MPEGDTLHRTAARLRPALVGEELVRFEAARVPRERWPRSGTRIESVEAEGKHLLIAFADGRTLHTHLQMSGSWHLYRVGDRWRKPAHLARAVVGTATWEAVCFSAPVVRIVPTASPPTGHLGPDLCRSAADLVELTGRWERFAPGHATVAEALLDQRIAAGIGNVYKSEVCWAERVDPFLAPTACPPDTVDRLYRRAAHLLGANLGPGARTTVDGGLAVYGRRGRPCRRCGAAIRWRRHGVQARSTAWCPSCQSPGSGGHP